MLKFLNLHSSENIQIGIYRMGFCHNVVCCWRLLFLLEFLGKCENVSESHQVIVLIEFLTFIWICFFCLVWVQLVNIFGMRSHFFGESLFFFKLFLGYLRRFHDCFFCSDVMLQFFIVSQVFIWEIIHFEKELTKVYCIKLIFSMSVYVWVSL